MAITSEEFLQSGTFFSGADWILFQRFAKSRDEWTWKEVAAAEQYSEFERLKLLLNPNLMPERLIHQVVCDFVEHAMQSSRDAGRGFDEKSWRALWVARQWIDGKATGDDLREAVSDAMGSRWKRMCPTVDSIVLRAAWVASKSSVDASMAAINLATAREHEWQLAHLVKVLSEPEQGDGASLRQ